MPFPRRSPGAVYYGWWVLAGAVVCMAVGNGIAISSFGLYVDPLEQDFGWTRAEVTLGFSVSMLVSGIAAPLVGRAIDAHGPRRVILLGTPVTAATYLLLAATGALWQWYVFLGINALIRQTIFYIPFQALVARWFDRRRGTAVSILGAGLWLGSVVMVPIMEIVIDAVGWDGAFIVGGIAITGLYLPLAFFLIRDDPADWGDERIAAPRREAAVAAAAIPPPPEAPAVAAAPDAPIVASRAAGMTVREAARTPIFWALTFSLMLFFYPVVGWMVHAVPYYESVGLSSGVAAGLVSATSAGAIVVLLIFGAFADRLRRVEHAAIGFGLCLVAAMLVLLISGGSTAGIGLFIVLFILGFSGGPLLEPLLLVRAFGVANFATILGATFMLETLGLVVSPALAGAIFDETGSYDWALVMFAISAGAGSLGFWLMSRLPQALPAFPEAPAPAVPAESAAPGT